MVVCKLAVPHYKVRLSVSSNCLRIEFSPVLEKWSWEVSLRGWHVGFSKSSWGSSLGEKRPAFHRGQIKVPALLGHPTKSEGPHSWGMTFQDERTFPPPHPAPRVARTRDLKGLPNVKSGYAILTREEEGQRTRGTRYWPWNSLHRQKWSFHRAEMMLSELRSQWGFESKSVRRDIESPTAYILAPASLHCQLHCVLEVRTWKWRGQTGSSPS
jgi:hypothetical protein